MSDPPLVEVAVARPAPRTFTYRTPPEMVAPGETTLPPGARVEAPLGRSRVRGVVLGPGTFSGDAGALKPLLSRPEDPLPALPADLLSLGRWVAAETVCSLGLALDAMAPPAGSASARKLLCARITAEGIARLAEPDATPAGARLSGDDRRILTLLALSEGAVPLVRIRGELELPRGRSFSRLARESFLDIRRESAGLAPPPAPKQRSAPPELNREQRTAADALRAALASREFGGFLLHGVTGSGKTEVYLDAVAAALDQGRSALLLVPEIALTLEMERLVRSRFGTRVAVFHSGLTAKQRREAFWRVRKGEARVALGARSAVFAPVRQLGLVVLDEEHDAAYGQDEAPRYHARRAAWFRARAAGAVLVLGSATPSLEATRAAQTGALRRLRLTRRVGGRPLAAVELVDMRPVLRERRGPRPAVLSPLLAAGLREAIAAGRQALVLLNRRGYRARIVCLRCGEVASCERCALALSLHRRGRLAVCHGCGRGTPPPGFCPGCGGDVLRAEGVGTERLQEAVAEILPDARVERFDRDTTRAAGERARLLRAFRRGEIEVLVGTQMIAKGLDFPGVALVGVVAADAGLGFPDFRAAERTFQLLTQVAGRAGRGEVGGRAVVQTLNPEHYAVRAASDQDYAAFAQTEMELRERLGYPPFARLTFVTTTAPTPPLAEREGRELAEFLLERLAPRGVEVLGPAPAPPGPGKAIHRRQILLRAPPARQRIVRRWLHRLLGDPVLARRTAIHADP